MKIVEATWEKRNLGRDVFEITVEKQDLEKISDELNVIKSYKFPPNTYVVIKIPVGNLDVLHKLQDEGFYFMEVQIKLGRDIRDYRTPKLFERFTPFLEYASVDKNIASWENVVDMIESGMFSTDRIALDGEFGESFSSRRYKNWCLDLFEEKDTHMGVIQSTKDGGLLGFNIIRHNNNKIDAIISGLFNNRSYNGLGFSIIEAPIFNGKNLGANFYETSISSNNLPIVKLHTMMSFVVMQEQYVLRKIML